MKLLPLGTIIEINKNKLCIIGYGSDAKGNQSVIGYLTVRYPLGFTNVERVLFVPSATSFEIVAEGYKTEPSEKALNMINESFQKLSSVTDEEVKIFSEVYKRALSQAKEGEI